MLPGNMMRVLGAVAGVAMVLSGCEGCKPVTPVLCTDTTITIRTPTSGQTVDSPFEVTADVTAPDGSAFAIDSTQLTVDDGTPIDGTVSGNRASFTGVAASPGAKNLKVIIRQGSCSNPSAVLPIVVRDACSNPAVTAVTFPQDVAPVGTLNRTEIPPGTNLQVKVDAMCVTGVQVRIKRGTTEVSPLTAFVNGSALITLPSLPDSDTAQYELFAELVSGTTAVNTLSSNPEAKGTIRVDRALPGCSLSVPAMCLGPSADADQMATGFQLRVTGTMATGTTGTIVFDNRAPVSVSPSMTGDVSSDFTLASSGTFMATITCTDGAGNTNTATGSYCADFTPPTVAITSPANVDGGATAIVTASPLVITAATDAEDGSLAEVLRNGVSVGTGTVSGGMVSVNVPFGSDGTFTLTVRVTDLAGNAGTATLVVTVALTGCGASFSRPLACPALLTPAQMPSGAYAFQTTSKPACANQPAALFRSDALADGGVGAEIAAGTTTLSGAGLANYPALTLTSGAYVFRGQVTNIGPDAGVASASCQVTVDLEGPSITNPIVPTGQTFATINAVQDTQTSTPGVQRVLTFSARVPVGGRIDVCTTQALNPNAPLTDGGFQTRPTSPECGSGWYVLQQGVTSPANGFSFPDGSYDVKIVVVGGGLAIAPASAPVAVFVDSIRPCVNGITRSLPQDLNGDNRLNITELGGAAPRLVFGLGCGDTSPTTLATAGAVTVRDIVSGAAGAVRPSTATFANGSYTVTLTGTYSTEMDLDLFVELTDLATNKNLLQATNDPGRFTFRVDPVAPVCNIASPSAALLGIGQVPGGNLDVIVATSADVSTAGVNVTFTGQAARPLTPTLSQAQTTYALTGDNSYTIGATCTDQSGNPATATARTTRVDLVAPTCNITAPADAFASSVNDITTTVAVTGLVDNDTVTLASSLAGITNNQLTVAAGSATRLVRYPNGVQTITASASDAAGNACVAPTGGRLSIALTVNSTSCNLDFNGGTVITNARGSWINRVSGSNPTGASPATVSIGAVTSDCGAGRNVYLYQGAPSATPSGTPQVTAAGGVVNFAGTAVSDGQQWTITIDNGAGVLTHRSFIVSFAMPSITSIGLQRSSTVTTVVPVAPNASLIFGAASGNRRVQTAVATDMAFADLDVGTADAQFQLTLTGIDGARAGGFNADLDVLEGSTSLMSTVAVTAAPFTPTLPRMKLGHRLDDTTTTLVIRITSPAGNVFTSSHPAEVDVIAPASPTVTQSLVSARAATVGLSWMPVYDDAMDAASGGLTGGPVSQLAGYDVRWTTSSVPLNNSMAAIADFFGSSSNQEGITTWLASATSKPLTLPPLNTYFIAVEARDEVGNYSVFSPPTALNNPWTRVALATPVVASNSFGAVLAASGSLNGDAIADVVIGSPNRASNIGSVYVYFGSTSLADQVTCALPACQEIQPYDSLPGNFGIGVSTEGNVGDLAAESKADLLIGAPAFQTDVGRAFLFFGTSASSLATGQFIELRGTAGIRLGSTARIIKDIDGDGLDEVALSAHSENANQGRVYIFKGRSADVTFMPGVAGSNWFNSRTATDGVNLFIPTSAATWVLDGPPLVGGVANEFGRMRWGFSSIGDITGDSRSEFFVPMSRESSNRGFIYSASVVASSSTAVPAAAALQAIQSPTPSNSTSSVDGFSRAIVGGRNIVELPAVDLVVAYPLQSRFHIYRDLGPTGAASAPLTFSGASGSLFGFALAAGELNSDAAADLVVGQASAVPRAWVLWQRGGTFDSPADFVVPQFNVSTFTSAVAGSRLGRTVATGDVDGDGSLDVIIGDEGTGQVWIYR